MTTYRQYQRMPAHVAARRFNATTQQLRNELSIPEPANDFTDDPSGSGRMLVTAFGVGGFVWSLLFLLGRALL